MVRIACVDDDAMQLATLRRTLASEALEVVTFEDPLKALEQIVKGEFSAVISDNRMPGLTGMDLLTKIKASNCPARRILLTGATDLNQAIEAFNAGIIHGFLNKPWKNAQLIELVNKEIAAFKTEMEAVLERNRLAEISKSRGTRLVQALNELKTAKTELSLIEDRDHLPQLDATSKLSGLAILVVEDNANVRKLLVDSLKRLGIAKTAGAEGAAAALEMARQPRAYDVILAEWTLQDMDGLKLFKEMRQSGTASAKAQFVLMAGVEQKTLIEMALNAGIDSYLIKPFRIQTLLHQLERLRSSAEGMNAQAAASLKDTSVLVANSQPSSREQILEMLGMAGIREVYGATFGSAALRLIREKRPQVVIYDINMDKPDWEEIRVTLATCAWHPAFVLTGVLAADHDWERVRNANMSNFVPGPFTQKDLIDSILAAREKTGATA